MILFSPAKINLGLQILHKREDGFHDISTCMFPVPLRDIIEVNADHSSGNGFKFTQTGVEVPGILEENLVYRAWELFCKSKSMVRLRVHLHKKIPMGAGLGGGSSNGVAILKAMNKMVTNPLSTEELEEIASKLGSDCPFFVREKPALSEGRGERLSSIPVVLSGYFLVILHPGFSVSTSSAYANCKPRNRPETLSKSLEKPPELWRDIISNDFEATVFEKYPQIGKLKSELYEVGAIYASMSGSGSSIFGIFNSKPSLSKALDAIKVWEGFI